ASGVQALRRGRDRGAGRAADRHVRGRLTVRAHGGDHPGTGVGARDPRGDRRSTARQARRQTPDDPLQPVRPRQLRSRRLRGVSGRQARGLRIPVGEGRRSAQERAEGVIAVRRLRLGAADVLLLYLTLHFTNHALGLVSLDAMEAGRWWFLALWRSAPGTVTLYGAITVHGILALWLLYERRTLRMPLWEAAQYALGLALPPLLVAHVVGTRIAW